MQLQDYYRSSAAYRVRIALNLKGVTYAAWEVHLLGDGGEHLKSVVGVDAACAEIDAFARARPEAIRPARP